MSNTITVSVPGKIHLMGEHAIVYGKPAILTTIDKRLKVTISMDETNKITINSHALNIQTTTTIDKMVAKTQIARTLWKKFNETKDLKFLKGIIKSELDFIELAIIETFAYYQKQFETGFTISIESDILIGSGLGSSAALAVGVVAAITAALKTVDVDPAVINEIAYSVEKFQHGTPSGGDNTAITYGGLVWFRKESELYKIMGAVQLDVPKEISDKFVLINSGKPKETTGDMVAKVRQLQETNPQIFNQFLAMQEQITRDLLKAFKENDAKQLIQLVKQGEMNLESIGVVSETTQKMIREIEQIGGAAKICGGGGFKTGSGIVLAFHANPEKLNKIAQKYKFDHFTTTIGGPGLKIETAQN